MDTTLQAAAEIGRAKRLKAATSETHDRLDKRIMAGDPFAALENYGRFLAVQYQFHRDLEALYADAGLAALVPDLADRRRLDQIGQDLADLNQSPPATEEPPRFLPASIDLPTALGWLYVAEGSNLGAAFLFKMARALGLDENHGARHLAGHPDGRAQHWRSFTAALDGIALDEAEEKRVIDGANAAFRRVHALVEREYA
ncbi:MAG: biliverdin-producing heme oxygenase [Novosphingobium lindaniclasticum]|jgi:heme oxygenase|uniref:biliverdin-producing heme oxygenase n=1 Tax=Novosphingobium lindaniclasticum TaxID=1329895 RepID=UPI002409B8A3|nr:biliverdin-producing heme oxygenase [Novosphingobium lindaniclasticum]MDF2640211.1 biliverdin-producing heme oxygenase [Novosphingobium lindaniclasticum]